LAQAVFFVGQSMLVSQLTLLSGLSLFYEEKKGWIDVFQASQIELFCLGEKLPGAIAPNSPNRLSIGN
jgi:hypothetical protein